MTTDKFPRVASTVRAAFNNMSENELFRVNIEGQEIWDLYLASFPEGTNPIFRTNTHHDGSYDRSFIRRLGNVVQLKNNGSLLSLWTVAADSVPEPYKTVFTAMGERVEQGVIENPFRIKESVVGNGPNSEILEDGSKIVWVHFTTEIASRHQSNDVDAVLGKSRENVDLMRRSFEELKPDAVDQVIELIKANNLYRGAEFLNGVEVFKRAQTIYLKGNASKRAANLWQSHESRAQAIRNTVIGTLIEDLSKDVPLDVAVKGFEAKVAPANYKRPTALVTQGMIDKAVEKITELGLDHSLERRMATIADVAVNNVLWVNGEAKKAMKGGAAALLDGVAVRSKHANSDKDQDITMDDFIANVLPKASSVEVFVSNGHEKNFVTITTAIHTDATQLFKWANQFAWSYNGNITDAIKERVKAAGGNVDAPVRVSLSWSNHDDLDLHAQVSPAGHVYYATPGGYGRVGSGRILDVDANAGYGQTRTPVENLAFTTHYNGKYEIAVNQYSQRETDNIGFEMQIVVGDETIALSYDKAVRGMVKVASFEVINGEMKDFKLSNKDITSQSASRVIWNVPTQDFVPVETVMLSPNFWDDQSIGNKHWFFILKGCNNPDSTRGIYNEFLKSEFEEHRKVFEILGNKTKCEPTDTQLSGIGFSSTNRTAIRMRVKGASLNQIYKISI